MTSPSSSTNLELQQKLDKKISAIHAQKVEEVAQSVAQNNSLSYVDLKSYPIDTNAVLLIPENEARNGLLAVITKTGQELTVAISDPTNAETLRIIEELKTRGYSLTLLVVSETSLNTAWARYAQKKEVIKEAEGLIELKDSDFKDIEAKVKNLGDLKTHLLSLPISGVVDTLLASALQLQSSDIHLEPEEKMARLRFRLDGVLHDITTLDSTTYPNILSRIKLLSGLKINIHEAPQDGRFTIRKGNQDIEVRISVLPGGYGENVVMRILDPSAINKDLKDLGMRADTLKQIEGLLQKTNGSLLTTGPTGSGKTTTLYAFIKHINDPGIKIITIEDPIEYHVTGIAQTQVDEAAGYTFAGGLRSIVRQDPDVILVGEIRDTETAEIALQAALTGHLVFSTLHTNDAAGAIPRLIDLGIKPTTIAPAIKAAMAQRLIRKLCDTCKEKKPASPEDQAMLKKYLENVPKEILGDIAIDGAELFYPKGCEACNQLGYKGRVGVFEIFEIDADMERLILKAPAISEISDLAKQKGMVTMLQDGLIRTLQGLTSIEEVVRVVGE